MHFSESFSVRAPPEAVFAYAADFRNLPDWDPTIISVDKSTPGEIAVGTEFRVKLKFFGFDTEMSYRVEEWEPGRRAVLRGTTPVATAIDTVTVARKGSGTGVTWDAEIRFVFPLNVLDPLFTAGFRSTVTAAVGGLQRALRNLPGSADSP